ncbi:CocE/NonD family hydrolase [Limnobacter sp.]|uniref:CocE/NonD family hydrolase n=1 Tax=Limnobacter sp. TaxID=2003368 RepID=UPI00311F8DE0
MTVVPFNKLLLAALLGATLGLAACGSDDTPASLAGPNNPTNPNEEVEPTIALVANFKNPDPEAVQRQFTSTACSDNATQPRAGGNSYSVNLQSASGHNIAFTVFEPAEFNCDRGNPLVLEGHGYGGSRATSPRGIMGDLIEAGAGVISIDQRGFGESGGSVRVLDPDFEGQDLLQILDWAEANLDWLRYASTSKPAGNREFNMVAGATGGSYGGGYQLLIHNIDPLKRLDALTPDIAWNDLRYSLNPGGAYGIENFEPAEGNVKPTGTVKSGWALLLVAGGESGSLSPKLQAGDPMALQTSGQDNLIRETLLRGATANRFPEGALEFFRYHSPSYWCDSEAPGAQSFLQSEVTPGLAQKTPDPIDILFTQGFRDTLFNFNDAFHNFSCYRALEDDKGKKADVRLLTHQSGHILPLSPSMVPGLADLTEQGSQNGLNEIEFQKPGGPFACGDLSIREAQFAFLVEKLFTPQEVAAIKNASESNAFTTLAANKGKVCLSLNDDVGQGTASENAAVWVNENTLFSNLGPQAKGQATNSNIQPVAIDFTPGADPLNVLTSAVTGILRYPFAPAVMPIDLPAGVNVVAGIPTATFEIAPPVDMLMNPVCGQIYSATAMSPIGLAGLEPGCDPMLFVGLGVNRNGAWRLIDDQVTPIRGFGKRHVEMTGVAERLAEGETLGLLVYGYHPQYLATASRDLVTPLVALRGTLNLPTLQNLMP